jgi:hypothetical protein
MILWKDIRMTKIFVFGSNLAGRHGAGAAKYAKDHYGAVYGVGIGPSGCSYAIPTKDYVLKTLTLNAIERHIKDFIEYAEAHPDDEFLLTPIGCGLAGYRRDQIRPLIEKYNRPSNVIYTKEWEDEDIN